VAGKLARYLHFIEATMAGKAVFPLNVREAMKADLPRTNRDKSKDGKRSC